MAPRKATKKQQEKGMCLDCRHAYLMRSEPCNPIVAECTMTKERWVASMSPDCGKFARRIGEPVINPMIFLNRR